MLPMANFWIQHASLTWALVVLEQGVASVVDKIKRIMLGREQKCQRLPSLTNPEMVTLRLLASGYSNQDIARKMACDPRKIYRFQYSLCKKLGGLERLRELRFKHAIVSPG